MTRFFRTTFFLALTVASPSLGMANEQRANAVIDKAIKAIGGEELLSKVAVLGWKFNGKITLAGFSGEIRGSAIAKGLTHHRNELEMSFNDIPVKATIVFNDQKGWRNVSDAFVELNAKSLANEKRLLYLQLVPVLIVPLKSKDFKYEALPDEKVDDKPASVLKITGPDGKDFKLYFDQKSGYPTRQVAKVVTHEGFPVLEESSYSDYKPFNGIQIATKIVIRRNTFPYVDITLTESRVNETVDSRTFSEPG